VHRERFRCENNARNENNCIAPLDECAKSVYKGDMKRKNVMLTDQQVSKIKEEAEKRGISFSEMLRKIIDKFFRNAGGEE